MAWHGTVGLLDRDFGLTMLGSPLHFMWSIVLQSSRFSRIAISGGRLKTAVTTPVDSWNSPQTRLLVRVKASRQEALHFYLRCVSCLKRVTWCCWQVCQVGKIVIWVALICVHCKAVAVLPVA
jgi:hypothetical protein